MSTICAGQRAKVERGRTVVEHRTASDHPLATTRRGLAVEATQPSWRSSMYAPLDGKDRRRRPNITLARELLAEQGSNCTYCSLPVEATTFRRTKLVQLRLTWDHFVPVSYSQRNPRSNWRVSCQVCNGLKHSNRYENLDDARQLILRLREKAGYESSADAWARLEKEPYSSWIRT